MYGGEGKPIPAIHLDITSFYILKFLNDGFLHISHGQHSIKKYYPPSQAAALCYDCCEHEHLARQRKTPKITIQ